MEILLLSINLVAVLVVEIKEDQANRNTTNKNYIKMLQNNLRVSF